MKSVFLTGASGVGKSTVYRSLTERGFTPSPNHLSRPKRDEELDGFDAHFLDRVVFENKFLAGEYLEQTLEEAEYVGVYYGSPRKWLDALEEGNEPIVAVPSNVIVLRSLCTVLDARNCRENLLWVNLVAPIDVRRERITPRIADPLVIEKRLTSGVSQGLQPDADLNIDTSEYLPLAVVENIIQYASRVPDKSSLANY